MGSVLDHAKEVVQLLVENSYVRFGDAYFHQTQGIPMGINPAVFMANYYLFDYEHQFVHRLVRIIRTYGTNCAPGTCPLDIIMRVLNMRTEAGLRAGVFGEVLFDYVGDAAWYGLTQFVYMVRYVDDLTSGPNRLLKRLLYTNQSLMGGMITGIYPQQFLTLEPTSAHPCRFPTLDVCIESRAYPCPDHPTKDVVVRSTTRLYVKRQQACYAGIPIVRYTHVASTLSAQSGYNIVVSQLHRYRELIWVRGNYVMEVAKLVRRLQLRGYKVAILWGKLKKHLRQYYCRGHAAYNTRLVFQ